MAEEFVLCPKCQLRHRPRAEGICPRCGAIVDGVAEKGGSPAGLPDLYEPPAFPASATPRVGRATASLRGASEPAAGLGWLGVRLAGGFFILNGVVSLLNIVRIAGASKAAWGGAIGGIILGCALFVSEKGEGTGVRKTAVALPLVLAGFVGILGLGSFAALLAAIALAVALLVVGEPGKVRVALGSAVLAAQLVLGIASFAERPWATEAVFRMVGLISGEPVAEVAGQKRAWRLVPPKSTKWYAGEGTFRSGALAEADAVLVAPAHSAMVSVGIEPLPGGKINFFAAGDAILENLRKAAGSFELIAREEIYRPAPGILFRARQSVGTTEMNILLAVIRKGQTLYVVQGIVPGEVEEGLSAELREMIDRFVPAEEAEAPQKFYIHDEPAGIRPRQFERRPSSEPQPPPSIDLRP